MKLMGLTSTRDLMQMLDLSETIDLLARANSVRWYGHVLTKYKNNFLRRTLDLQVSGTRKVGRPKKTWLRSVMEQRLKVRLNEYDANNRLRGGL